MPFLTGLIGRSIATSFSPALHEREATRLGLDLSYALFDLAELGRSDADAVELIHDAGNRHFAGLNITHPCKRLAIGALDDLAPSASAIDAVNTVTFADGRATGHTTDGLGFVIALSNALAGDALPDVGSRIVLVGAGGAGASIAHALLEQQHLEQFVIIDADPARAAELRDRCTRWSDAGIRVGLPDDLPAITRDVDGLIHATPTGMHDHPGTAVPIGALRPGMWVAEVVYRPATTTLMIEAARAGCTVVDGVGMVVHQAAEAFRLVTGIAPDAERMMQHARELIGAESAQVTTS